MRGLVKHKIIPINLNPVKLAQFLIGAKTE